jgi:hypothetical protein
VVDERRVSTPQAEIGLADAETVYVHLDLPEIEDLIPETSPRVLKDGRIKQVKRKKPERNHAYARLATGLAFMMGAATFATAPTVHTVRIAAYTQRKQRRSHLVEDAYVYEVAVPRPVYAAVDMSNVDPLELLATLESRMKPKSNYELTKLEPPTWAAEFAMA